MKGIIEQQGIPLGVYTDRHAVFQPTRGRSNGTRALTQGGRALRELGITHIVAHSPEAKGRVERTNGTFQDRLVAELRLAGASTLADANRVLEAFLPRFNERFGVPAAQSGSAYRVPDGEIDVEGVLSVKEWRRVAKDNTVPYHKHVLQLFPDAERPSYAGARVAVHERSDGRILVSYRGKILTPQEAPPLAATLRAQAKALAANPHVDWEALYPPAAVRQRRPRAPVVPGPLAGETIWYEDPVRKDKHRELVRAGMERARQEGRRIGRPKIIEREGFLEQFAAVVERLGEGTLSRRKAAKELDIGYATLKRLLDACVRPPEEGAKGAPLPTSATTRENGNGYEDVPATLLTKSLDSSP